MTRRSKSIGKIKEPKVLKEVQTFEIKRVEIIFKVATKSDRVYVSQKPKKHNGS